MPNNIPENEKNMIDDDMVDQVVGGATDVKLLWGKGDKAVDLADLFSKLFRGNDDNTAK